MVYKIMVIPQHTLVLDLLVMFCIASRDPEGMYALFLSSHLLANVAEQEGTHQNLLDVSVFFSCLGRARKSQDH